MNRDYKFRAWDKEKYIAGSDGLIYSTDFNHTGKTKALKGWIDRYGYPQVLLNVDGKRLPRASHRLVALAFIGKPPTSKHQVNHKNGVRSDNRPENLEWVTSRENTLHGFARGRKISDKQKLAMNKKYFTIRAVKNRLCRIEDSLTSVFVSGKIPEKDRKIIMTARLDIDGCVKLLEDILEKIK